MPMFTNNVWPEAKEPQLMFGIDIVSQIEILTV